MSRLQDELEKMLIEYTQDPFDVLSTEYLYHDNGSDIVIGFLVNGKEVSYRYPIVGTDTSDIRQIAKKAVRQLEREYRGVFSVNT